MIQKSHSFLYIKKTKTNKNLKLLSPCKTVFTTTLLTITTKNTPPKYYLLIDEWIKKNNGVYVSCIPY